MFGSADREDRQRSAITALLGRREFRADTRWIPTGPRKSERVTLAKYRAGLRGRVLELGMGGGRITDHLITIAESLHRVDIAPNMVAYCQQRFPQATFTQEDFRRLSTWPAACWDAVYGGCNTFDVLAIEERDALISDVARLLRPEGLFIFSSHNYGSLALVKKPWLHIASLNPRRSLRGGSSGGLRAAFNYRRLAALQRVEEDYAVVVDDALDFSLLQIYIARDAQERQLAKHGLQLLECIDEDARVVAAGETGYGSITLDYVARRT